MSFVVLLRSFLSVRFVRAICLFAVMAAGAVVPRAAQAQFRRDSIVCRPYEVLHVGLPLIVTGTALRPLKYGFQDIRNGLVPGFRYTYDDFLQYAPAAAVLVLKTCGVSSADSWGRMLAADAMGFAAMAALVNAGKYTFRDPRPDGSSRNSFPSGHTATAFAAATMLHHEYGGRSVWYSVGGYTAAVATGISRILNNRHWISDVVAGAGIGIVSMEIGYWLADEIFGERGRDPRYALSAVSPDVFMPSSLGLTCSFRIPFDEAAVPGMVLLPASAVSIGGAGYVNDWFGLCASAAAADYSCTDGHIFRHFLPLSFHAGPCAAVRLPALRFSLEAALAAGYTAYLSPRGRGGMSAEGGLSLKFASTSRLRSSVYAGWIHLPPPLPGASALNSLVLGLGVSVAIGGDSVDNSEK